MSYTFELRPLHNPMVLSQLAEALEERSRMQARPRSKDKTALTPKELLQRKKRRYRVYLAALAASGLPLLLVGALLGEIGTLLGGAVLVICCGLWLWFSREPQRKRVAAPQELLTQVRKAERAGARVIFDGDGMHICPSHGGEELVPYRDILYGFEMDDLLVLTGERRAVALQTLELSWGDWEEFRDFLSRRVDELVDLRRKK